MGIVWFSLVACSGAGGSVRVLSYNIHHGRGTDGRIDLKRIARIIRESKADIVALQEVDRATKRSNGVDQAARLAQLTHMHLAFGKAIDFAGGEYGIAILSRWPILEEQNHPLPFTPGREARTALVVRIKLGSFGSDIRVVNTHLDHTRDPTDRLAAAQRLNHLLMDKAGLPALLVGDLNAVPDSQTIGVLLEHWSDSAARYPQPTSPANDPRRRIDYVLFRPASNWRVVRAYVLDEPIASDHRPLLVLLRLK